MFKPMHMYLRGAANTSLLERGRGVWTDNGRQGSACCRLGMLYVRQWEGGLELACALPKVKEGYRKEGEASTCVRDTNAIVAGESLWM